MMRDELRDDEIRTAEWERKRAQRCVDCRRSWWIKQASRDYRECVGVHFCNAIGACVIEGDPLSVMGITADDTAETTYCDLFEAVDE